jgi:hypothetical protein
VLYNYFRYQVIKERRELIRHREQLQAAQAAAQQQAIQTPSITVTSPGPLETIKKTILPQAVSLHHNN